MIEAVQFHGAIKRCKDFPWRVKGEPAAFPLLVSVLIRIGLGFGLALAASYSNQVSGPLGAIALGVAAPLVIEQMARRSPPDSNETAGSKK
ncbi:hypothetical protein [Pseudonocardia acaciae]|uniref:hypothetical protein n=1 Tax=Pseudonocardia acaciae TaxID=551276 RepID=UPI00147058EE|nr:hypothetical protein [Pseudonocardia acaciae]